MWKSSHELSLPNSQERKVRGKNAQISELNICARTKGKRKKAAELRNLILFVVLLIDELWDNGKTLLTIKNELVGF